MKTAPQADFQNPADFLRTVFLERKQRNLAYSSRAFARDLGMSQALLEGNRMDPRTGRWTATNLAEYLVPVNADAPDVTVDFVDVDDDVVGPLGAKGVGEIGQVGVAAAIANAVFHATGRRIRDLPMTPELVMDPTSPAP